MSHDTQDHRIREPFTKMIAAILALIWASPGFAQLAYEGMRQGIRYKVYIYAKEAAGEGRWRFQTKAVYRTGAKPYYSNWREADCLRSTIDGELVTAIAQYGFQEGDAAVLKKVCGH